MYVCKVRKYRWHSGTGTVVRGTNAVLGLGQRPLQDSSNIHVNKFYVCNVYHILRPYVFAHFVGK